ncbi:Protein spinster-like 2, partial [Ophiophagus hannah]
MVAAPIFGYLGDRFNRKIILSCGIFFWSAITFSSSFITEQNAVLQANSADCQQFDPDRLKVDSAYHPFEAQGPDLDRGVLRSGPWGHLGNSEGPARGASASKNGLVSSVYGCDGLLQPSASENGARESHPCPSRAPFSLAEGCRRPRKLSSPARFRWQSIQATTGAPDTNDVELDMPTPAMPTMPL